MSGLVFYGAVVGKHWIFETVAVARQRGLFYALDRPSWPYAFPALEEENGCPET